MRLIFVYAGSPHQSHAIAPYSITNHMYTAFQAKGYDVVYYNWDHTGELVSTSPDDIIIGHAHYNGNTALRRLYRQPAALKCMLQPFHHALPNINLPFDDIARQSDIIFSISGPYWYDTIDQSPFAHWKSKMVRLDMAVDASSFKFVKTHFNPPGMRTFAYIGRSEYEKGTDLLAATFKKLPDCTLHCYGSINPGDQLLGMKNVVIHGWTDISAQWMQDFANQCDYVISMGRSDANPTSLLEGSAIGLLPICTKESGYWRHPMFHTLPASTPNEAAASIRQLDQASSDDLMQRAITNRVIVENDYTWSKFCSTVINAIERAKR
jgi:glycosyltransferase involved in cell wall biosynthesis